MRPTRKPRLTFADFAAMKRRGEKITVLTGYDGKDAALLDSAGIDAILVGDSIGNVRLGYQDTTWVTMDDMVRATTSVSCSEPSAMVVVDMPIHSYETPESALINADRLLSAGADAVKLEGGTQSAKVVEELTRSGTQVMGHIAYTPQTDLKPRVEGRNEDEARRLLDDAIALQKSGVFAIVIELADSEVAKRITEAIAAPTIGIGAGPYTDGQVLVLDDLLGWTDFSRFPHGLPPHFLGTDWDRSNPESTVRQYIKKVRDGTYPSEKESYRVFGR
jgi:3-methyl-2-oxobutanoate hydroxymethyltransferase